MAAIAPSALLALTLLAGQQSGEHSKAIRHQVADVAMALTAGNPADAMTPFDQSFADRERLRDYFTALANAYQMVNELEVTDEEIADDQATLAIHWTLTLSDAQTGFSETRTEDVQVKLQLKKFVWRIVAFSPIKLFDPQIRNLK